MVAAANRDLLAELGSNSTFTAWWMDRHNSYDYPMRSTHRCEWSSLGNSLPAEVQSSFSSHAAGWTQGSWAWHCWTARVGSQGVAGVLPGSPQAWPAWAARMSSGGNWPGRPSALLSCRPQSALWPPVPAVHASFISSPADGCKSYPATNNDLTQLYCL